MPAQSIPGGGSKGAVEAPFELLKIRYAILSDIHGNLEALTAVLADADAQGARSAVCLGDVVGYGADPTACVDAVADRALAVVAGNHEHGAVGLMSLEWFNPIARAAALWTRDHLDDDHRRFLEALPLTAAIEEATLVHASPRHPEEWEYLVSEEDGLAVFGDFATRLCFVGHSHRPDAWSIGSGGPDHVGGLAGERSTRPPGGRAPLRRQRRQRRAAARSRSPCGLRHLGPGRPERHCPEGQLRPPKGRGEDLVRRPSATARAAACPWYLTGWRSSASLGSAFRILVVAGALGALAFPHADWWLFAWVWLAPVLCCALARPPRAALADGWLAGTVFFSLLLRWLDHTFSLYSDIPWPLGWLPIAALAAYCGLYIGRRWPPR